jgi:hypothetical protein
VSEPSSAARPGWVHKRDGRVVPFDADQISRDLFAATEHLGQPDAFLARELTDSVVHFLSQETEGTIPTTGQIVESVVKTVRELGHPKLAQVFAQHSRSERRDLPGTAEAGAVGASLGNLSELIDQAQAPAELAWELSRGCLREYSLRTVFSRDLAAAHAAGLLQLGNLQTPRELAGHVLGPADLASDVMVRIHEVRSLAGALVALDGPDYALAADPDWQSRLPTFVRQLRLALEATGLCAVVNLNCQIPPPGIHGPADGPLFTGPVRAGVHRAEVADCLLEAILAAAIPGRVDWHLSEDDFRDESRLIRVCRRAAENAPMGFVLDRPRRPTSLAEGLDRQHSATLLSVGVNLPALTGQPRKGAPALVLHKLGSLVRLALAAGSQKRDFLRHHGRDLTQGFLLDRARLVLVPVGLAAAAGRLTGQGLAEPGALALARQVLQTLRQAAEEESRHRYLECCIDSAYGFSLEEKREGLRSENSAGVTGWEMDAPARSQIRLAGQLQAEVRGGTAAVLLDPDLSISAEELADLLRFAREQPELTRLQFVRPSTPPRPLPALWEG